jgi:hypothetical protein
MKLNLKAIFVALAVTAVLALALTSCSKPEPVQQVYQQQPQVIQQVPQGQAPVYINQAPAQPAHSGLNDMLLGGMIGHMLGSSGSNSRAAQPTTVINKTVNVTQVNRSSASSYRPTSSSSRSSFSSGGFRSSGRR